MENRIKIKEWVKKQLQKLNLKEGDLLIVTVGDKDHEPYPEMMQDLAKKFKELLRFRIIPLAKIYH